MANYQGAGSFVASFKADADLTTKQYTVVKASSTVGNVQTITTACAPYPLGVLINDPSAGQEAAVVVLGFTKAKAKVNACILDSGTWLTPASTGLLEPVGALDGTRVIIGRWFGSKQTTADTSVLGDVLILGVGACAAVQGNN